VRQLTHTLQLPPAHAEIYGGPYHTWLRDILEHLPNLQSLLVSQLPFFDHHALIALRQPSAARTLSTGESFPFYGLRLLIAAREPNMTSIGLTEALRHMPCLVYLDLSYTTPARDPSVLAAMSNLPDLQVLKLRQIGLRDAEVYNLVNAIGIRVRLLDLRNNLLTDSSVRVLLHACFMPPEHNHHRNRTGTLSDEDWPSGIRPGPDLLSLDSLKSEDLDQTLVNTLTSRLTGRLAIEDLPHRGLTHLYIADNQLTVEGLESLLKSTRLHLLDGGSVDTVQSIVRARSSSSPTSIKANRVPLPGAEKLVATLSSFAVQKLSYLRVHHAVVTEDTPAREQPSPVSPDIELPGDLTRAELSPEAHRFELDGQDPVFELDNTEVVVELSTERERRLELPGDCIHFAISPPVNRAPTEAEESIEGPRSPEARRGSVFAPEVVEDSPNSEQSADDEPPLLDATGSGLSNRRSSTRKSLIESLKEPYSPHVGVNEPTPPPSPTTGVSAVRNASINLLISKRPPSDSAALLTTTYLHPSHLPRLRTLVLTDVPPFVPASSHVVASLIRFITACGHERILSHLQAQTVYSLPPGRSRTEAEAQHAREIFALETIVLEMAPKAKKLPGTTLGWNAHRRDGSWNKSSTGDPDSDNFWRAAENDFSFFGEMECGVPNDEYPGGTIAAALLSEKLVLDDADSTHTRDTMSSDDVPNLHYPPFTSSAAGKNQLASPLPQEPQIDVVTELSKFRREKKAEYQRAFILQQQQRNSIVSPLSPLFQSMTPSSPLQPPPSPGLGRPDPIIVEGYWPGDIKVVRSSGPPGKGAPGLAQQGLGKGTGGCVDIYGNYFESGYLYP
jgi:hypothetical protein